MIYRGEQDLADLLADGRITAGDADAVRTFALFLREQAEARQAGADAVQAWRVRWLGYVTGTEDGPS